MKQSQFLNYGADHVIWGGGGGEVMFGGSGRGCMMIEVIGPRAPYLRSVLL